MLKAFHKIRYLLAALILTLSAASLPTAAHAEDTDENGVSGDQIQVSPTTNSVDLEAGQVTEYEFYVKAPTSATQNMDFTVYATPYTVINENYDLSFTTETNYTQISRWISFKTESGEWSDTATYTVAPGEQKYVIYRVSVPEDVPAGSQYATIFIEVSASDSLNSSGVKTVSRAGIVVYGTAEGDTNESAEITDYSFDTFKISGTLTGQALIKNTGNTDFSVSYSYTVKNLFSKELYKDSNSRVMLPETEWRITTDWAETPIMGIFQVSYRVSAGDTTRDETKIVMVLPIWVMIIMGLLLTIIIVWVILFIRKRKERRSRMMVS